MPSWMKYVVLSVVVGCCLASSGQQLRDYSPCNYFQNLNGQWEIDCDSVAAVQVLDAFRRNSGNAAIEILVLGNMADMTDAILADVLQIVATSAPHSVTRLNLYRFPGVSRVPALQDFTNLQYLYFYYMDQLRDLPAGALRFTSQKLRKIFCAHGNVAFIDPAAFQGRFDATEIYLYFNNLTTLDPAVFKPLLTATTVTVTDNPILCDCHLAWIIRDNPQLLDRLTAYCTNPDGSRINIHLLDSNRFKDC